jgi:anti-sigma-K factor RskA
MSAAEFGTPRDLAAAYALGALDAPEAKAFEELLARDAELAREVAEYREVAALLALAEPASPPDGLRARVLAGAPPQPISPAPSRQAASTGCPGRWPRRCCWLPGWA